MRKASLLVCLLFLVGAAPAFGAGAALEADSASPNEVDPGDAPSVVLPQETRSVQDWYRIGGPTMHALVLCSVLIGALILERAFAVRRARFVPKSLLESIESALEVGQHQELKGLVEGQPSHLGRLAQLALEGASARERLEAGGSAAAHEARRNLPALASLGNIATMLGLLGTVVGMVEAFDVIARSGTSDARIVATGIFQALVTTAAGLAIGIIALAAHSIFSRRAADLIVSLESIISATVDDAQNHTP